MNGRTRKYRFPKLVLKLKRQSYIIKLPYQVGIHNFDKGEGVWQANVYSGPCEKAMYV